MEWKQIRAQYEREFSAVRKRGVTQEDVARAGGLLGKNGRVQQNAISKLLGQGDESLGPQIMTLVKAVEGLGLKVSVFFAAIEASQSEGAGVALERIADSAPANTQAMQRALALFESFNNTLRLAGAGDPPPAPRGGRRRVRPRKTRKKR